MSLNRSKDAIFVKNLEAAAAVTSSQTTASATVVDLGVLEPNVEPMVEQDVSAISGTNTSITDTIDGSKDGTNWDLNIKDADGALPAYSATVAGRQIIGVPRYRYYRRGVGQFAGTATPSVTRSLKIIGVASARPVTQP